MQSNNETNQKARERMALNRAAAREIVIGDCKNPSRRRACRLDLPRFARTYFSKPPNRQRFPGMRGLCYLPLSNAHVEVLQELQSRILYGGLRAEADPRGWGKDTLAIVASIWAAFYGHSPFTVFACFEFTEAQKRIETIKAQIEINEWLFADFPEFVTPVRALERAAQRAKQQTYQGEYTRVEWGQEIVLPTIKGKKIGGAIIMPASLSGSIRGTQKNGRRPSFVILTDPQTAEVAKSLTQIKDTMDKIKQDFGGLGSMDDPLACLALVTIIRKHDVADQLTNPMLYPQWSGERRKAIIQWPRRMELWDEYESLLEQGKRTGDVSGREACRFYLENRADMDEGSQVIWESAFIKALAEDGSQIEYSALQHFMNLRWSWGREAFQSEYQNDPEEAAGASGITPEIVAGRVSLHPHMVAPAGTDERLIQFIDINGRDIHYAVLAVGKDGSGCFIDYARLKVNAPDGDLRDPKHEARPALEWAVLQVLRARREETRADVTAYRNAQGDPLEIALTLVDSGWLTESIYAFIRESGPRWRATKGDQSRAGNTKFSAPRLMARGIILGQQWYGQLQPSGIMLWHLNADHWKLHVHERFLQDPDTPGAVSIYGHDGRAHRNFAWQVCNEEWDPATGRWREINKQNHYLDCAAGCFAAASMLGIKLITTARRERPAIVKKESRPGMFPVHKFSNIHTVR